MEKDKEIYNKCAPTMELPYQSKKNILPDKNYIVMLTYLPLARYRPLPQFLHFVFRIVLQLQKSPGLVGYTLRAGVLKNNFGRCPYGKIAKAYITLFLAILT